MILLFNKPYGVLSQFTDANAPSGTRKTLSDFIDCPGVYPAGRLDRDSEGLMVLTDDGALQARLSHPRYKKPKTYWVQVEGHLTTQDLAALRAGLMLRDGKTRPANARTIPEPEGLWERQPPIRVRKSIPETWLEITLTEGRNRQVRRMTAAIGFPTLRLVRWSLGDWTLAGLAPGAWRDVTS